MKRFATWGMIATAGGLLAAAVATVVPEKIARPPAEQVRSDASARVAGLPAIPDAGPPALSLAPSEPDGTAAAAPPDARPAVTGSIPVPLGPDRREAVRVAPPAPPAPAVALGPYRFSARREAGTLVLSGAVPDAAARDEIVRLAREQFFHERIVDETHVAAGAPPRFRDGARLALGQLAQLASGEATLAGTSLRIRGHALYAQAAEDIRHKTGRNAPAGWAASAEIRTRSAEETDAE
ncbi:MAG TPA: hypothetical protein VFE80_06100 [Beijerinckiaceae bacterium]|nr:hypothetical protein [Beijerinckiaceae bacterium]